jgi:hypothetical protein
LTDGTLLQGSADFPRGNPENPVSTSALEEKCVGLLEPRFGRETAARAIAFVRELDRCGDVSAAVRRLSPVAAAA